MKTFPAVAILIIISTVNLNAQAIEGQILDAANETAIPGVKIEMGGSGAVYYSGPKGRFTIPVSEFPVVLNFYAPDFMEVQRTITGPNTEIRVMMVPRSQQLSEVVLRSTIIPKPMRKTPASVFVLSEQELQKFQGAGLMEAISSAPGLYVHQGALNTNKISIRGIGSRSMYSTTRLKVFFEGIPLTTAEGITTLDDIPLEVVERIEIIKGPASSIYGAGLGGVINLYAEKPEEEGSSMAGEISMGSFGLLKNSIHLGHASEATEIFAAFNHMETDGFRENSTYNRDSFFVSGSVSGDSENTLSFLGNFTKLKAFIPSSLSLDQFRDNPSSAAQSWAAAKGYESYDKGMFGLSYQDEISEGLHNTTSIYLGFRKAWEPRPFDILKQGEVRTGARTKFLADLSVFNLDTELSFGAEFSREWYDLSTYENLYRDFPGSGSIRGIILSNNTQNRSYYNIFAQWNLEFSQRWNLEAGINFNSTSYELSDLYPSDDADQSGAYEFPSVFSPRLGLTYDISNSKIFYASVSHGFSIPTVAQTLTPEGMINTALQPETGINYEAGFKGSWLGNKLYSEIAIYTVQVENLLVAERVAEDRYIGRNAGETDHSGIELLLNYNIRFNEDIRAKIYANAAFNFFKFDRFIDDGINYSGNLIPGVPDNTITGGIDLMIGSGFKFSAFHQYVGEIPLNDTNSIYAEEYRLLNLKTSYAFALFEGLNLKIFGGLNNVLDEKYAASILPNAVGFGGSDPRYYYPGKPLNYFLGIELGFDF